VGFVVDKVALGQLFSKYFGFPCQFAFQLLLHNHHHLSSGPGTVGQTVAVVTKGTESHPMRKIKKISCIFSVVLIKRRQAGRFQLLIFVGGIDFNIGITE
jgi:hypothetical protein